MAKVQVAQVGSVTKTVEAKTVAEALQQFGLEGNYSVKLDGRPVTMETTLPEPTAPDADLPMISVGQKVKGGLE